ncbi:hypothetical protein ACFB49_06690 [Sphingomonas sp. DBB INV C78]
MTAGTPSQPKRVKPSLHAASKWAPNIYDRLHVVPLLGKFSQIHPDMLVDINLSDRLVDIAGG